MDPMKRREMNQTWASSGGMGGWGDGSGGGGWSKPEEWSLGNNKDPIPGSVWGSMGLWSQGGW